MTGVLIRGWKDTRTAHPEKRPGEDASRWHPLQAKKRGLRRKQTCWFLALKLLDPKMWESEFLLFKPLSVWNFVMADRANESSHFCTTRLTPGWLFLSVLIPSPFSRSMYVRHIQGRAWPLPRWFSSFYYRKEITLICMQSILSLITQAA